MNTQRLKYLVEELVKGLADRPEEITVEMESPREKLLEINVYAHPDDLKMIIGKGGKNIQAVRTLIYGTAAKSKVRCYIKVEDNLEKPD